MRRLYNSFSLVFLRTRNANGYFRSSISVFHSRQTHSFRTLHSEEKFLSAFTRFRSTDISKYFQSISFGCYFITIGQCMFLNAAVFSGCQRNQERFLKRQRFCFWFVLKICPVSITAGTQTTNINVYMIFLSPPCKFGDGVLPSS